MHTESTTCLVTGGAGYIGSIVAQHLLRAGFEVIVVDNLSTGSKEAVPSGAEFFQADVGDLELLQSIFTGNRIGAVLHFAGRIDVEESTRDPLFYFSENFSKPLKLLRLVSEHPVEAFVFSSTAAVYGEIPAFPVQETRAPRPINPYGVSKWAFEQALADVLREKSWAILRYFNVTGADLELNNGPRVREPKNLFRNLARTALGIQEHFLINGNHHPTPDGTAVRDYIHVEDLAQAHVAALPELISTPRTKGIWNLGSGRGFSVQEVLAEFLKHKNFSWSYGPPREGDPSSVVAATDLASRELGFRPFNSELSQLVESSLRWEKKIFL
ncbi:MAG: UDP-glucose 4-epimerase GalE [Bdellovibrio sp.]